MPRSKLDAMKDTHVAVVPKFLWDEIVGQHKRQEFSQAIGRDHSHCRCCNACNDGGCGPGTHKHKEHCSWAEITRVLEGVKFVPIKELLDGVAGNSS